MQPKKRLGELLIERRLISAEQLNAALAHQRQWGIRLGAALVAKGFVAEGTLTRVLAEFLGIPIVDLARAPVDAKAISLVAARVCEQYDVFPIAFKESKGRPILLLAMADPLNVTAIDEIAFTTGTIVKPAIAQISSLDAAIRRHYHNENVTIAPLSFEQPSLVVAAPSGRPPTPTPPLLDLTEEVSGPTTVMGTLEPLPSTSADAYGGLPTGTFKMPVISSEGDPVPSSSSPRPPSTPPTAAASKQVDLEAIEALEKKFWALMRILARRGLVTKDEFLAELRADGM